MTNSRIDDPAAYSFVSREPISSLEGTYELIRDWINDCDSIHHLCGRMDDEKELPTRVLQISGSPKAPSVKLMETNDQKGNYCALSHCWGPPDKRPLMTTRANLHQHLDGIPLEDLPKTFQDTVMLSLALGITYLWIDSLCIIQNNTGDWNNEAGKMGTVYTNATLVIAAAGAKDSTEGLFTEDRTQTRTCKLPYTIGGLSKGAFNIAIARPSIHTYSSPLRKRGWALQEWYLAPRLFLSLPIGIALKCKEGEYQERCDAPSWGFGLFERESWLTMLEIFSSKQLTYPSDRVHAVRGIAAEISKTREHQYIWELGVWEGDLIEQLWWCRREPATESESLNLPSWSWAATGGDIYWMLDQKLNDQECRTSRYNSCSPDVLRITKSNSLEVIGYLRDVSTPLRSVPLNSRMSHLLYQLEWNLVDPWDEHSVRSFLIQDYPSGKSPLGIG